MGDRRDLCVRGDHVLEALCRDRAVHVAFQVFHGRTVTLCGLLPWKNVAVMFHDADDDLVTRF